MNSRERELKTKREATDDDPNYTKFPKITASSRQWSNHKNPRIVRVSRTFGGKDRHSKVSTVRGLRDRRIRLSVPTAIHLYDLQDRLGLGQPSKVVDWLLDATKHEIEKLPPLPMLPPNFTHQSPPNHPSSLSHFQSPKNLGLINPAKEEIVQENQEGFGGFVSSQSLFPSPFPNMPYTNPYFQNWDPPNLSLSHIGGGYPMNNQSEDQSHLYFYPSATTIPSIIPSYISPLMETDWRNLQNPLVPTTLQLISSPMKPFTLNPNSNKSVYFQQSYNEKREKDERS